MTSVNKTIQVSSAQLKKTSSAPTALCAHHPKGSLFPSPFIPLLPTSTSLPPSPLLPLPFPLAITTLLSVSLCYIYVCARVYIYIYTHIYCFCVTFHLFFTQPPNPLPSDCCQSVLCIWVCLNCTLETYFLWYVNYILIKWFKTINGSIC